MRDSEIVEAFSRSERAWDSMADLSGADARRDGAQGGLVDLGDRDGFAGLRLVANVLVTAATLRARISQAQDLHLAALLGSVADDEAAVNVGLDVIPVVLGAAGSAGPVILVRGFAVGEDENGTNIFGVAFLVFLQELREVRCGTVDRGPLRGGGQLTGERRHV